MAEQWLSIVEYARNYQVSDMTVRRRIKTGRLHAVLKEGKYFIPVPVGEGRNVGPVSESSPLSKRSGEMRVIKAHPAAHATLTAAYAETAEVRTPQSVAATPGHRGAHSLPLFSEGSRRDTNDVPHAESESTIPSSLRHPLVNQDTSLVDTRALLAFCEASMRKLNETERRTVEKFKAKLEALEANLLVRDAEIKSLRQQVEDLQLLVKILESKGR